MKTRQNCHFYGNYYHNNLEVRKTIASDDIPLLLLISMPNNFGAQNSPLIFICQDHNKLRVVKWSYENYCVFWLILYYLSCLIFHLLFRIYSLCIFCFHFSTSHSTICIHWIILSALRQKTMSYLQVHTPSFLFSLSSN